MLAENLGISLLPQTVDRIGLGLANATEDASLVDLGYLGSHESEEALLRIEVDVLV